MRGKWSGRARTQAAGEFVVIVVALFQWPPRSTAPCRSPPARDNRHESPQHAIPVVETGMHPSKSVTIPPWHDPHTSTPQNLLMKPCKAIFPRCRSRHPLLLPATKSIPKEMLTVVDRPLIQYAVDEAVEAGIDTLIFVTGRSKNAIVDYFDRSPELEAELEAKGKTEALERVRNVIPPHVKCFYVRQPQPRAWAMPCCVPPDAAGGRALRGAPA